MPYLLFFVFFFYFSKLSTIKIPKRHGVDEAFLRVLHTCNNYIGVGRFRILGGGGGARFRILGGGGGGAKGAKFPAGA